MAGADQIGRQPRQEYIEAIHIGEIGAHDRPHVRRLQQRAPRHFLAGCDLVEPALVVEAANIFQLRAVHHVMLFRHVAVERVPCERPERAESAANVERPAPAERQYDRPDDGGRNGGAEAARAMGKPLGKASFAPRKPHLHGAGCAGKRPGFAGAEKKQQDHEGRRAARQAHRCRHERPVGDEAGQDRPRAEALAEPAAGHLKQCIGQDEGAENPAHGLLVKAEFGADFRRRIRNDDAIEIGDEVHEADHPQNVPPAIAR